MERRILVIRSFIDHWLQFQALWDLDIEAALASLGVSIESWCGLLEDFNALRRQVDTVDTQRSFGVVVIHFGQIQAQIIAKYDVYQKELLSRFGVLLSTTMKGTYELMQTARREVEQHPLVSDNLESAVKAMSVLEKHVRQSAVWAQDIANYRLGQSILRRMRYTSTSNDVWIDVNIMKTELAALRLLLGERQASLEAQSSESRASRSQNERSHPSQGPSMP